MWVMVGMDNKANDTVYVVFVTVPRGKGDDIAMKLLEDRLAACVNISKVESRYWWQGKIEHDAEDLLIIKTSGKVLDRLVETVKKIHPYTVPEIIYWKVEGGNPDYLSWVFAEATGKKSL